MWKEHTQKLEALARKSFGEEGHSGNVAARPAETGDEALLHRVTTVGEDDRYGRGRSLRRSYRHESIDRNNHGHLTLNQVRDEPRYALKLTSCPPVFDRRVLALHEAGFLQALVKCSKKGGRRVGIPGMDEPDHRHRWLLCARRNRPGRCRAAAKQDEEFAPSYA
jgi:hypothetical protein